MNHPPTPPRATSAKGCCGGVGAKGNSADEVVEPKTAAASSSRILHVATVHSGACCVDGVAVSTDTNDRKLILGVVAPI